MAISIEQISGYIDGPENPIFYCRHQPFGHGLLNQTVIICCPIGYEYVHSHRTLKHLADVLACRGVTVYRFDFNGQGDSPADELTGGSVPIWLQEIASIISLVRKRQPHNDLSLVGLRLGATLAYLASMVDHVNQLVLWEPVIRGRSFVRELESIARFAASEAWTDDKGEEEQDYIESAGFLTSRETLSDINRLNLIDEAPPPGTNILYIHDEGISPSTALQEKMTTAGANITYSGQPGFSGMMAEPHYAIIPEQAVDCICNWICKDSSSEGNAQAQVYKEQTRINFTERSSGKAVFEEVCKYDEAGLLFGVLCGPCGETNSSREAIVWVNSGSVHHVGPNRIYCHLSRLLAARGVHSLRIDIAGIGDSCHLDSANKNHPYQKQAVDNVLTAVSFLKAKGIANAFIVAGLCSGAHAAFHTVLSADTAKFDIREVFLINPLTFSWRDGSSLEAPYQYQTIKDAIQYSQSVRSLSKWKKLFLGRIHFGPLVMFLIKRTANLIQSLWVEILELVFHKRTKLSSDFQVIMGKGVRINLVFSALDPGLYIVRAEVRRVLNQGLRSGDMHLETIAHADHTFSRNSRRQELYKYFLNKFQQSD